MIDRPTATAAVGATLDLDEIKAASVPLISQAADHLSSDMLTIMMKGYELGFAHGLRSIAEFIDPAGELLQELRATEEAQRILRLSGRDVIRETERATRPPSDVRPHVPHVDPDADPRVHFALKRVTACGIPIGLAHGPMRIGTHTVGEQDCSDCTAALRQAAFTPVQQRVDVGRNAVTREDLVARAAEAALAGDLGPAQELARTMHPSAFEDEPPIIDVPADVDPDMGGTPEPPFAAPRGWDKIEGDPDAVEHLDPTAIIIGRSLDGELIDMTAAVFTYAIEHKLRRWQCRHCGRGRVMGTYRDVTANEEVDACLDHEAHCEHNPDRQPGTVTADA